MSPVQEFIQHMQEALRYPADDPYATTIVVLIIISAAVFAALALIAFALPHSKRSHAENEDQTAERSDEAPETESGNEP